MTLEERIEKLEQRVALLERRPPPPLVTPFGPFGPIDRCMICGEPGGHGGLGCPSTAPMCETR